MQVYIYTVLLWFLHVTNISLMYLLSYIISFLLSHYTFGSFINFIWIVIFLALFGTLWPNHEVIHMTLDIQHKNWNPLTCKLAQGRLTALIWEDKQKYTCQHAPVISRRKLLWWTQEWQASRELKHAHATGKQEWSNECTYSTNQHTSKWLK